jgi:hypothetical protein
VNLSLDDLVTFARIYAEDVLIGNDGAQLRPTFHVQFKGGRPPVIFATPWRSEVEEAATVAVVRAAIKAFRPIVASYVFMTEAWVAKYDHRPGPRDRLPSQREDRIEAVVIIACTPDEGVQRLFEILRDDKARVTELKPEKNKMDRAEGRFLNLFDEDAA